MGESAGTAGATDAIDATGEIRIALTSGGTLGVLLGPFTKARYSVVECAVTLQGLINNVVGVAWSRQVAAQLRFRAGVSAGVVADRESAPREDLMVRLSRVSASLDRAKVAVEEARQGNRDSQTRTAGRRDRVWIEARDGFVAQLLIDENYYAACPVAGLAADITMCLTDVMEPWTDERMATVNDQFEGGHRHD